MTTEEFLSDITTVVNNTTSNSGELTQDDRKAIGNAILIYLTDTLNPDVKPTPGIKF